MRGSRSGISILGRFDWVLLGAAALLGVMGMVTLTSIDAGIAVRQAVFWGIALVIILAGGFVCSPTRSCKLDPNTNIAEEACDIAGCHSAGGFPRNHV